MLLGFTVLFELVLSGVRINIFQNHNGIWDEIVYYTHKKINK